MNTESSVIRTNAEFDMKSAFKRMNLVGMATLSAALIALWAADASGADNANSLQLRAERHQLGLHPIQSPNGVPQFGEPLPDLSTAELAAFAAGRA